MPANINLTNLVKRPEFFVGGPFGTPEELVQELGNDSFRISLTPNLPVMAKTGYNYKMTNAQEQVDIHFPDKDLALFLTNISRSYGNFPHRFRAETFWCGDYFEQEVLNSLERLGRGQTTQSLVFTIKPIAIQTA